MLALVFLPSDKQGTQIEQLNEVEADYFMVAVEMKQFDADGKLTNQLMSDKLEHLIKNDVSVLTNPLIVFNQSSDSEWELSSKSGMLSEKNQVIELEQSVKMVNFNQTNETPSLQRGTTIATDSLLINLKENTASTKKFVTISDSNFRTKSKGLSVNFDDQIINLESNVTTEIFQ
jgi:LPS export ABC transporter protein LptC